MLKLILIILLIKFILITSSNTPTNVTTLSPTNTPSNHPSEIICTINLIDQLPNSNCTIIDGDVSFTSSYINTNFIGFENIKNITGNLKFEDNNNILNFNGFENLEYVNYLLIDNCDSIANITSFKSLNTIETTLYIYNNDILENLSLNNLLSVNDINIKSSITSSFVEMLLVEDITTIRIDNFCGLNFPNVEIISSIYYSDSSKFKCTNGYILFSKLKEVEQDINLYIYEEKVLDFNNLLYIGGNARFETVMLNSFDSLISVGGYLYFIGLLDEYAIGKYANINKK